MSTKDLLITTLLALVTPLVVIGMVSLAVRVIRWVKKNRARAAAMMTGTYLNDVGGGKIDTNEDSVIDSFINWLSDGVDAIAAGAGGGSGGDDGSVCADGGSDSGGSGDCGGGDGGGYCGGD